MLYKCTYESAPFWRVEFDDLWGRLEPGDIVLDMGEPPGLRGFRGRPYLKVFYGGRIGWVLHSSLVPLEEPAQAKNKKQKSAKQPVPFQ